MATTESPSLNPLRRRGPFRLETPKKSPVRRAPIVRSLRLRRSVFFRGSSDCSCCRNLPRHSSVPSPDRTPNPIESPRYAATFPHGKVGLATSSATTRLSVRNFTLRRNRPERLLFEGQYSESTLSL